MKEEDLTLIRQIARETIYEVLETEFYDSLFNMLNAIEGGITCFKHQLGFKKGVIAVKEETFTCLKFETQKGAKIGSFEVAYKEQNLPEHWNHAFNILKKNNATISNRYHGDGYEYAYWLYGKGRIYRQKLRPSIEALNNG